MKGIVKGRQRIFVLLAIAPATRFRIAGGFYVSKPVQKRCYFVKGKHLCFNCLGVDHMSCYCKGESKCKTSSRPHHTILRVESLLNAINVLSSQAVACRGGEGATAPGIQVRGIQSEIAKIKML